MWMHRKWLHKLKVHTQKSFRLHCTWVYFGHGNLHFVALNENRSLSGFGICVRPRLHSVSLAMLSVQCAHHTHTKPNAGATKGRRIKGAFLMVTESQEANGEWEWKRTVCGEQNSEANIYSSERNFSLGWRRRGRRWCRLPFAKPFIYAFSPIWFVCVSHTNDVTIALSDIQLPACSMQCIYHTRRLHKLTTALTHRRRLPSTIDCMLTRATTTGIIAAIES